MMRVMADHVGCGDFPVHRPRRLRRGGALREAVADVRVTASDLIYPMFVGDLNGEEPVASMPGVSRWPVGGAVEMIVELSKRGLTQFMLFGVTDDVKKDSRGTYAADVDAPVNCVLKSVRDAGPDVVMYADLCLCEYTDHGHCGVLSGSGPSASVDNDRTLEVLATLAQVLAASGADVVAPSGMMDGQVAAVRRGLDGGGYRDVAVMSYTVKYASSFYGPFREAGGGGMKSGDRCGYQMDFRRSQEWAVELEADLSQGTDMVMVKPAAAYLDIVRQVRDACSVPVGAYHVSGEYAMLCAAAERGWVDLKGAVLEVTHGMKRAGADLIVTYFAPRLVGWLSCAVSSVD